MQEQRLDEHRRIVCPGGALAPVDTLRHRSATSTPPTARQPRGGGGGKIEARFGARGKASRLEDRRTRGRGTAGEEETCAGEDDCAVVRDVLRTGSAPSLTATAGGVGGRSHGRSPCRISYDIV